MTTKYNGWSNYETWVAYTWISNSEAAHSYWHEVAVDFDTVYDLALRMERSYHKDMFHTQVDDIFFDLLASAFQEINWYEIAKHYMEDK